MSNTSTLGADRSKILTVNKLVILAMLIALEIIFARFLSFSVWNLRIGLSFLPIVLAAMLYGPVEAGIVGAVSDFLGAIVFPTSGAYFPGFTLTAAVLGVLFGLFLRKKQNWLTILLAVLSTQLICTLLLNTFWISTVYGADFGATFYTRLTTQTVIMAPVQFILIFLLKEPLNRVRRFA